MASKSGCGRAPGTPRPGLEGDGGAGHAGEGEGGARERSRQEAGERRRRGRRAGRTPARPARKPRRPASIARRKAAAMAAGSPAVPMAVLTRTASAPTRGLGRLGGRADAGVDHDGDQRLLHDDLEGRPGAQALVGADPGPRGITVAQPASSSRLHRTGSAGQYGGTVNPSRHRISAACSVSTGSGRR